MAEAKQQLAYKTMAFDAPAPQYEQWDGARRVTSTKQERLERQKLFEQSGTGFATPIAPKKPAHPAGDFLKTKFGWTFMQKINYEPAQDTVVGRFTNYLQSRRFIWLQNKAESL